MPDLTNQIILVTGANHGQGKAIAEHLASSGAIVVIGARNFADAEETADIIGKDYTFPVQLDVTKESDWQSAVDKIVNFDADELFRNIQNVLTTVDSAYILLHV